MISRRDRLEAEARASAKAVYLGDGTVLAVVLGRPMVLDSRDRSVTPHLCLSGFWESWVTLWVMDHVRSGDVVVNVGAQCGYYAVLCAALVGRAGKLVAIEPMAHHARNIRHSLALNGLAGDVVEAAAGAASGTAVFEEQEFFTGSNRVVTERGPAVAGRTTRRVRQVTVDEVASDATFVLVDAEGYEPEVWAGMSLAKINVGFRAVIEWTPERYENPADFLDQIGRDGFRTSFIDTDGTTKPATREMLLNMASGDFHMVILSR